MEVKEHGAKFAKEKTVRVSYSSEAIPGGDLEYTEEFIKENKPTLNININPKQNTSPDPCMQPFRKQECKYY